MAAEADSNSQDLNDRVVFGRAVEAVIWGMPLVNYQLMHEAAGRAGGAGDNQIVYWPGLLDSSNQTLTPNPDLIYAMPFFNTKHAGPIVLLAVAFNGAQLNLITLLDNSGDGAEVRKRLGQQESGEL